MYIRFQGNIVPEADKQFLLASGLLECSAFRLLPFSHPESNASLQLTPLRGSCGSCRPHDFGCDNTVTIPSTVCAVMLASILFLSPLGVCLAEVERKPQICTCMPLHPRSLTLGPLPPAHGWRRRRATDV